MIVFITSFVARKLQFLGHELMVLLGSQDFVERNGAFSDLYCRQSD